MEQVVLREGRDRSVRRRHPWVLSGALAAEPGESAAGALVALRSAEGEVLGHGLYAPRSQIRVRLVALGKEPPAPDWLARAVARAVARRAADPLLAATDAVRWVNAEGDGLPGLVADSYAGCAVVRIGSLGMARRREEIADALAAAGAAAVFERADAGASRREGFDARGGWLRGEGAPDVAILERGRRYRVDVAHGQKTGFYLDQRDARDLVERLAEGRRVLDLFAYTGGFAAAAARGGAASVTLVESSEAALARAREHVEANRRDASLAARYVHGDAFAFLREDSLAFDLAVVDPPPLARRRGDVARASRAYKDLLLHVLRGAAPGARILFFRCSHHVDAELLRKIAFAASLDAGRPLRVLGGLHAPADHPVALDHPEGEYLSGLLLEA